MFLPQRSVFYEHESHKAKLSHDRWSCDYCKKVFHSEEDLDLHFNQRHNETLLSVGRVLDRRTTSNVFLVLGRASRLSVGLLFDFSMRCSQALRKSHSFAQSTGPRSVCSTAASEQNSRRAPTDHSEKSMCSKNDHPRVVGHVVRNVVRSRSSINVFQTISITTFA